jgi:hypothetical protein
MKPAKRWRINDVRNHRTNAGYSHVRRTGWGHHDRSEYYFEIMEEGMRWTDGPETEWHSWFAWYPKSITNRKTGETVTVWWEYMGRKKVMGYWFPSYIYNPDPSYKGAKNDG